MPFDMTVEEIKDKWSEYIEMAREDTGFCDISVAILLEAAFREYQDSPFDVLSDQVMANYMACQMYVISHLSTPHFFWARALDSEKGTIPEFPTPATPDRDDQTIHHEVEATSRIITLLASKTAPEWGAFFESPTDFPPNRPPGDAGAFAMFSKYVAKGIDRRVFGEFYDAILEWERNHESSIYTATHVTTTPEEGPERLAREISTLSEDALPEQCQIDPCMLVVCNEHKNAVFESNLKQQVIEELYENETPIQQVEIIPFPPRGSDKEEVHVWLRVRGPGMANGFGLALQTPFTLVENALEGGEGEFKPASRLATRLNDPGSYIRIGVDLIDE